MNSKKIVFLILHYKSIKETIECIDSINNVVEYANKEIIVVDNGSNNGTYEELKRMYKQDNLYLLKSEENLGFARGNNLGFLYSKKNLNPDFIVMINSDVVLIQKDFGEKILAEYTKKEFDVLGPDIMNMTKTIHSNPINVNFRNKKDIKRRIVNIKRHIILCKYKLEYISLIKNKVFKKFLNKKNDWKKRTEENIELHGSCLIFSKKYIDKYDGISDQTFLYYEESFLYYICQRDKLNMIYSPELQIIHNESKTTKELYRNIIKRKRFYYENALYSCERLLNLVEKDNYWE